VPTIHVLGDELNGSKAVQVARREAVAQKRLKPLDRWLKRELPSFFN